VIKYLPIALLALALSQPAAAQSTITLDRYVSVTTSANAALIKKMEVHEDDKSIWQGREEAWRFYSVILVVGVASDAFSVQIEGRLRGSGMSTCLFKIAAGNAAAAEAYLALEKAKTLKCDLESPKAIDLRDGPNALVAFPYRANKGLAKRSQFAVVFVKQDTGAQPGAIQVALPESHRVP
jgi:hypothetical protein